MTDNKVDIEQIKDKLKIFGRKSSEKLKELGEELKNKIEERAKKATEDDGSVESQAPAGQKQPKNTVDELLAKIPTISINIGKRKEDKAPEETKPEAEPAQETNKE
ncbi:MAG: hypothetical protein IKD08_02030 [Alphaproteobacteria bacterium]|nr:hypothetical protein [Alphaproteobacteria bacterium]